MKISDNTSISMPMRNLIAIIGAVAIGTMAYFGVIERLNKIETNFQLMQQDLIAASEFIDGVPKGDMVSPQIQELFMLVEYLGGETEFVDVMWGAHESKQYPVRYLVKL